MRIWFLLTAVLGAIPALAQAPAREAVPLDPAEREHVLAEMRDFLGMLEKVNGALAKGDFDAVAAATRARGGGAARMPPALAKKLPPGFRAMARSTHEQIDAIAADAARREPSHTLGQVSTLLATCNACHAAYQFPR